MPYFSVDHFGTCSCFILLSTNRKRCSWELNGGHSFWTRVVKLLKVAAFSHLVLKSNNFEKIKYAQKKEILRNVQYKKTLADPLH